MRFTSNLIKKAWTIRKNAAKKFDCKVSEISWSICLQLAKETKMIGSEKQIKWAEDLKAEFNSASAEYRGKSPVMDKALDTILNIEYAAFWIDKFAICKPVIKSDVFSTLKQLNTNGFRYKGSEFSARIKMDNTGNVTKF